jgi:chromosome segregation ATPase
MKSCLVKSNILYKGVAYGPGETALIADEDFDGLTGDHVELLGSDGVGTGEVESLLQKRNTDLQGIINKLEGEKEKLTLKVFDLEKKTALQDLNNNIGDKSAYITDLQKERDEQIALVEKLKAENGTLNQGLEDFETEVQKLKSENEKLTADLKAAEELMNNERPKDDLKINVEADVTGLKSALEKAGKKIILDEEGPEESKVNEILPNGLNITDSESAAKEVNKTEEKD